MSAKQNEAIVHSITEEIWNKVDLGVIDEIYDIGKPKMRLSHRLSAFAFAVLILFMATSAAAQPVYYGVENDKKSQSAECVRDALKQSTGTKGELPFKINRTGPQILDDLDQLVKDYGEDTDGDGKKDKLMGDNGTFIFHYSGHGALSNDLKAVIGLPEEGGAITSDQLVDKLISIVPECLTVVLLVDSCGAGNFKKSLEEKISQKDGDGKAQLSYYGVFATAVGTDPNASPRTVDNIGRHVKAGLKKDATGKAPADADGDGKVSVQELGDYLTSDDRGNTGFSGNFQSFDFEGEPRHLEDHSITSSEVKNQKTVENKPADKKHSEGRSGGSSINYDAALQCLSFSGHQMVDTKFFDDPILDATVNIPDFLLDGALSNGDYLLKSVDSALFEISQGSSVFMRGDIPFLTYSASDNLFYGVFSDFKLSSADPSLPFHDPSLLDLGSPWIAQLSDIFDPSSFSFDPDRKLYFTYESVDNMLGLTESYFTDGTSGGSDGIFGARPVPEPSSFALLALGTASLGICAWRQRKRQTQIVYRDRDTGAADKAAIQLVKVQPCQSLVSDT